MGWRLAKSAGVDRGVGHPNVQASILAFAWIHQASRSARGAASARAPTASQASAPARRASRGATARAASVAPTAATQANAGGTPRPTRRRCARFVARKNERGQVKPAASARTLIAAASA